MVQFQPVYFFPYEVLILILVVSVFTLIYMYLSRSLNPKKNRYLASIEGKISDGILSSGTKLTDEQLDEILKKHAIDIRPPQTLSPTASPADALKDDLYEILNDRRRTEAFLKKLDLHERKIVSDFISIKRLDIIKNKKSEFRLRDLQQINENPVLLNQIYEERTSKLSRE